MGYLELVVAPARLLLGLELEPVRVDGGCLSQRHMLNGLDVTGSLGHAYVLPTIQTVVPPRTHSFQVAFAVVILQASLYLLAKQALVQLIHCKRVVDQRDVLLDVHLILLVFDLVATLLDPVPVLASRNGTRLLSNEVHSLEKRPFLLLLSL